MIYKSKFGIIVLIRTIIMIVTFFGHRDLIKERYEEKLYETLLRLIDEQGADTFYLGGRGNFDRIAAETLDRIKKIRPHICRILILAYCPVKREDFYLPTYYDESMYPPIGKGLIRFAIERRNYWMAENCDIAVVGILREIGGAYKAFVRARARGKTIINICEE